jgi:hypothetical protein
MYNLAAILRDQVDLKGVRSLLEEVLEISRRKYGADHSNTLATMHNIACTLVNQGDFNGSRRLGYQQTCVNGKLLFD